MSRVKTLLIAIILVVGILFPTTTALASPEATVSITDATLTTGASGSVVLSISATELVSCIDIDVSYDAAVVEVIDASGSDFDSLVSNIQNNHTHLVAYVTSPTGLTGTIKVADISLTRLGGESALTLDVITLKDDDGNSIPFTVDNGWVAAPAPAAFSISNLSVEPIGVDPAEAVTITVFVTNTGGVEGSYSVVLEINGVKEAEESVTVAAGSSQTVTFTVTREEADSYTVAINGLSGSFTVVAPAPTPSPGGAPAPPAPPHGTTDVRGMVTTAGVFLEPVTTTSEDELLTLTIPEGTVGLTEELEPLDEITVVIMDEPPDPPEDAHVIGLTYDLGPDGATFDPPITLTFSYDPDALPEGVAEEDLVLAYYDEEASEWVELVGVVDTVNNTITASVPHFTTFAIIGVVPVVAPPEEEEVPIVVPPVGEEEEEEEPEVVITVPPEPAAFSVSNLAVEPTGVKPGEVVTVSTVVANTGGESGSYTVVLKVNGVKEAEETVTVAAGESQDVSFSLSREEAGDYSVTVGGLSGSFTVVLPVEPPGVNWPLFGGIIAAAVIVAGLLIYFLVFRRRAYY